jgi:hypothetical protein
MKAAVTLKMTKKKTMKMRRTKKRMKKTKRQMKKSNFKPSLKLTSGTTTWKN